MNRSDYIAGLRKLADLLENREELPLPYEGRLGAITMTFWGRAAREDLAAAARALPTPLAKNDPAVGDYDADYYELAGDLDGVKVKLVAYREQVCERVVTGTRTVTEDVPDPDALAKVPTVTRTRVEEITEWRCHSILGDVERRTA